MGSYGIHHLDLRVSNYKKSLAFYDSMLRSLRFRTVRVKGEVVTYYIKGSTALGIRPVKKRTTRDGPYSYRRAGIHHLAFSVESRSALDNFYERLKQGGIRILYPRRNILAMVEAITRSSS